MLPYRIILCSQTGIALNQRQFLPFLITRPSNGDTAITVSSEFETASNGESLPDSLVFDVKVFASTIEEAQSEAATIAYRFHLCLAFLHNAYVHPPEIWVGYAQAPLDQFRTLFTHVSPRQNALDRPIRKGGDSQMILSAVNSMLVALDAPKGDRLIRSIQAYALALERWHSNGPLLPAEYLYIAAESSAPIVVDDEVSTSGKSLDILLAPHLEQALENFASSYSASMTGGSPGLSEEEKATLVRLIKRSGYPSAVRVNANNLLRGSCLRKAMFAGDSRTYSRLRAASDGFEHGYAMAIKSVAAAFESVDSAAKHIRTWLMNQLIVESSVREHFLSEPFAVPLMQSPKTVSGSVLFRSPHPDPNPLGSNTPFLYIKNLSEKVAPEIPADLSLEARVGGAPELKDFGCSFPTVPKTYADALSIHPMKSQILNQ